MLEAARALYVEGRRGLAQAVSLRPRLHRRSVRLARRRRILHRGNALRAQLALRRVEGGRRPPRARLLSHLRPARRHHQLLEQLRPLPVSREAHPAHHPERARGQTAPRLRRRQERPRLALRRRPLRGAAPRRRSAACPARRTTSAATTSERRSRSSHAVCDVLDRRARRARAGELVPRAHHLRRRPPGPRSALRHRPHQDRARARLGSRPTTFAQGHRARPSPGTSTTAPGASASRKGSTSASGSVSLEERQR